MTEHWSDCATNNEPESAAGPCNCGGFHGKANVVSEPVMRSDLPGALGEFLRKWFGAGEKG